MTTPNLDATGHWWVEALVKFNFQLEYQKGWDSSMADVLRQITTCLSLEAGQLVLDGVTLGATQRAEGCDPAMVEGDHNIEMEVCVAVGWILVEMHVTNWAAAQRQDPVLDVVLNWLEAQKKTDLRTLLENMLLVRRAKWCGRIVRISWLSRMPSIDAPCPKGRIRIYCSLWSQKHTRSPLWMGVIEMQDTKAVTVPCPYYKNPFGGQEWPTRWDNQLGLHTLPPVWGWLPKGPFTPHCGYCSPGSPACWFHKHWDHVGAKSVT